MSPIMLRTLDFIQAHYNQTRLMPTLEEICAGVGFASRSSAHKQVQRLVGAGHLLRTGSGRRNIALPHRSLAKIPTADLRAELARREVPHG